MRKKVPFTFDPFCSRDNRGKLVKLGLVQDQEVFPNGVLDEYIAYSSPNVFRGFHIQAKPHGGNKVFMVLRGSIELFVLSVKSTIQDPFELRKFSLREGGEAVVVPEGFFTGYLVLEESIVQVKSSFPYNPNSQDVIPPKKVFGEAVAASWTLSKQDIG